nr:hypothetical protein Ade03nite_93850 [Actinoplanes derwentensis]
MQQGAAVAESPGQSAEQVGPVEQVDPTVDPGDQAGQGVVGMDGRLDLRDAGVRVPDRRGYGEFRQYRHGAGLSLGASRGSGTYRSAGSASS